MCCPQPHQVTFSVGTSVLGSIDNPERPFEKAKVERALSRVGKSVSRHKKKSHAKGKDVVGKKDRTATGTSRFLAHDTT